MWEQLDKMINDFFEGITVADLLKENQNKPKSENLVHFDSFEETVIRGNSPEKEAAKKVMMQDRVNSCHL